MCNAISRLEAFGPSLASYLGMAVLHSLAWSVLLLTFASVLFRRRDFL
ncbi:MAG: hypothetical protein ABW061_24340 [Polyangiaceae bacterium]